MSGTFEAFHFEMDYLWNTVKEAQDSEARCAAERSKAKTGLERAASRVMHLERELAKSMERERLMRAETEQLRTAAAEGAENLALAAAQAQEVRRAADKRAELEGKYQRKESETVLLGTELTRLRSETAGLRETIKGRDYTISAMKEKLAGLLNLPELSRMLAEDSKISGKQRSVYEHLVERLEKEKREAAEAAAWLARAESETAQARKAAASAEKEAAALSSALALGKKELEALRTAMREASDSSAVSSTQARELKERAAELKIALGRGEAAMERAASEAGFLRRELDAARAETARLRDECSAQAVKTDEQRKNFAGAVKQIFDLQNRASALRTELADAKERNAALAADLAGKEAALEKLNGLLRDAKSGLALEKESARRNVLKLKALEHEIDALRDKAAAEGELLRAAEERGQLVERLRKDNRKAETLELENDELRRKIAKVSGLHKREHEDFAEKVIDSLERAARGLKLFKLRLPASGRKPLLDPALRNLQTSLNLLKGWQEYADDGIPELQDCDLAALVAAETGKWERAFRLRGLEITAAIAAPRLRVRLNSEKLKTLFYHLAKNAYERLPQGGSLHVALKVSSDEKLAVVSFEDDGPGFTREALDRLFEPFNTTDARKAGIGLAVARHIAERHGGTLEAGNGKDRGALVELKLPLNGPAGGPSV